MMPKNVSMKQFIFHTKYKDRIPALKGCGSPTLSQ